MKTLVNKQNPQIRITAPEIKLGTNFLGEKVYGIGFPYLQAEDWTLVEEEPKHTEVWVEGRTIFEQDAKKPEIDLEKEIDMFFDGWSIDEDLGLVDDEGWSVTVGDIKNVARHFYELGKGGK